jgi:hypothetical protein
VNSTEESERCRTSTDALGVKRRQERRICIVSNGILSTDVRKHWHAKKRPMANTTSIISWSNQSDGVCNSPSWIESRMNM